MSVKKITPQIILILLLCLIVGCSSSEKTEATSDEIAEVVKIIEEYVEPPDYMPPTNDEVTHILQLAIQYSQENFNITPEPYISRTPDADTLEVRVPTEPESGYILYFKKLNNQWIIESEEEYADS